MPVLTLYGIRDCGSYASGKVRDGLLITAGGSTLSAQIIAGDDHRRTRCAGHG